MKRIENDCYGCCLDSAVCDHCPQREGIHYYCDRCQFEIDSDEIYIEDGMELCEDCLKILQRKRM